ncbi:hypothetical protein [Nostoc sp. CALU 546]|uniref:hypothetical protein n=1 Tax=Nostoc sp. CALU 546 TaxID=1867241 RepID=UPI003B681AC2
MSTNLNYRPHQESNTGLTQKSPQSLIYRSRSVPEAYRQREASRREERREFIERA